MVLFFYGVRRYEIIRITIVNRIYMKTGVVLMMGEMGIGLWGLLVGGILDIILSIICLVNKKTVIGVFLLIGGIVMLGFLASVFF